MPFDDSLRKYWKKAGYRSDIGSAAIIAPPPRDFIRLYHLTSAEIAINNIALGRLKVARFSELNDPFELLALSLKDRTARLAVQEFKRECDGQVGLLCFSSDWTNPVLWGHYGNKHRGICLGFDLNRQSTMKVSYTADRISTEIERLGKPPKVDDKLKNLLLSTKFKHWEYEEEYRVLVPLKKADREGSLHFIPFNHDFRLTEVIIGPQCELSLRSVRALVRAQQHQAISFKARPAFKFFKVVPDGRTVPRVPNR